MTDKLFVKKWTQYNKMRYSLVLKTYEEHASFFIQENGILLL